MDTFSRIARGIRSPRLFLRQINRLYHRNLGLKSYNTSGVDIFAEDWDNLLLLDACRYDMFEQQSELPGRLESRISRGSATVEFLRGNLQGRELHDTVYVTANPQFYRNNDWLNASFHAVENIWMTEGWDDTYSTVMPETLVSNSLDIVDKYPNKRLLVHFIQPHYPFISDEEDLFDSSQAFLKPDEPGSWDQLMTGELSTSPEMIWRAYRGNLDYALPHVQQLLENLDGKSVVSSDHGNMVGERARPIPIIEWGHPRGIYTEQLVKVPWLVIDGNRREITEEPPVQQEAEVADEVVSERLQQLGYV